MGRDGGLSGCYRGVSMRRTAVIVAALGLTFGGPGAMAGTLVPGGWLEPIHIPKAPPPIAQPPAARPPAERVVRRPVRQRRPPGRPQPAPPPDGKVRF
jgi:hypothetical protein